jgi:hypothetical protein
MNSEVASQDLCVYVQSARRKAEVEACMWFRPRSKGAARLLTCIMQSQSPRSLGLYQMLLDSRTTELNGALRCMLSHIYIQEPLQFFIQKEESQASCKYVQRLERGSL